MVLFLDEEWDIETSQPSVSRMLKEYNFSHKQGTRSSDRQNEALKDAWQAKMKTDFIAEQLIFIDEKLLKEQTAYFPRIGNPIGTYIRGLPLSVCSSCSIHGGTPSPCKSSLLELLR